MQFVKSSHIPKKIGIIGCAGFIGSHLVEALLQHTEAELMGIDLHAEKIQGSLEHSRFQFFQGDYRSEHLDTILQACDVIISLASICNPSEYNTRPVDTIESNFTAPSTLVQQCADQGKWLIHVSTSEVYGKTIGSQMQAIGEGTRNEDAYLLKEDETPLIMGCIDRQRWSYATAKQLLERMIVGCALDANSAFRWNIIRPFNFVGSRMDYIPGIDGEGTPRVISCFMDALLHHKPLPLVDGGHALRTFTYIDDVMQFFLLLLSSGEEAQNQIYNVANTENELSIRRLAESMLGEFQKQQPLLWKEREQKEVADFEFTDAIEFYGPGYDDSDRRLADVSKALKRLEWKAEVSIPEALQKTIAWYCEYYSKVKSMATPTAKSTAKSKAGV